MWLINIQTLQLEEFVSVEVAPPYAILSHTWEDREISFKEFKKTPRPDDILNKPGYWKVSRFCELAAEKGVKYAWADTCCIDKRSSAELSEAINSMYEWYKRSTLCIVYMQDVKLDPMGWTFDHKGVFRRSRWFTRGWTLQELLAPQRRVGFYDTSWSFIGTREMLRPFISEASGIDEAFIESSMHLSDLSVATRMSWAANRSTTRVEDMAYCLLGLFGVNMPLLYGEGSKAFTRLQEEIIRTTPDQSIFAWCKDDERPFLSHGILADDPSDFKQSGGVLDTSGDEVDQMKPYTITHLGLEIYLPYTTEYIRSEDVTLIHVPLHCCFEPGKPVKITLWVRGRVDQRAAISNRLLKRRNITQLDVWDTSKIPLPKDKDAQQLYIEL